jgi:hypothetical protein
MSPYFFFEGLEGIMVDPEMPKDLKTLKAIYVMEKIKNQKAKDKIINLIMELGS